jgi:hypothetical protein
MINPQWGFNPIIIRMLFAVTLFQQKPTPEKIIEMVKYKAITYQRNGSDNASKSRQKIPKASTSLDTDLSVDLGSWIANAKVLVPVSELIKIPSQKGKLLKAIEGPVIAQFVLLIKGKVNGEQIGVT